MSLGPHVFFFSPCLSNQGAALPGHGRGLLSLLWTRGPSAACVACSITKEAEALKDWLLHNGAARVARRRAWKKPSPVAGGLSSAASGNLYTLQWSPPSSKIRQAGRRVLREIPSCGLNQGKNYVCSVCILRGHKGVSSAPLAKQPRGCVPPVSVFPHTPHSKKKNCYLHRTPIGIHCPF
jgi:hypothetical protein